MAGDLAAFGAPDEVIAEWGEQAQPQDDTFEVLAENWDAVCLFCAASTQWRHAGMAGVAVGLDYAGVEAVARALELGWTAGLLDKLRTLEAAALAALAETTGALQLIHGVGTGNVITIDAPNVQLLNPRYTESEGDTMLEMDLSLIPGSGGDDELKITTT